MSARELPGYLRGMTKGAVANVEDTGVDVRADLGALVSGETDAAALLASCLRGADADREQGWRDYVSTLASLAEVLRSVAPGPNGGAS